MKQQLLLLQDVDDLGKSGEVVSVKAGYARNFLIPQKVAIFADKHTLLIQAKLQEERVKKGIEDKKDAEALKEKIQDMVLSIHVKVDPDGKMYGSVSIGEILDLFAKEGHVLEKKYIQLKKPIKETGIHEIPLKLKEEVTASFKLKILPEGKVEEVAPEMPAPPAPVE